MFAGYYTNIIVNSCNTKRISSLKKSPSEKYVHIPGCQKNGAFLIGIQKNRAIHILFVEKKGSNHIPGSAEKMGAIRHAHLYYAIYRKFPCRPPPPPPPALPLPELDEPNDKTYYSTMYVRPAKTQISLYIDPLYKASFLDGQESEEGAYCTISEGSDQNVMLQSHCLYRFGQLSKVNTIRTRFAFRTNCLHCMKCQILFSW